MKKGYTIKKYFSSEDYDGSQYDDAMEPVRIAANEFAKSVNVISIEEKLVEDTDLNIKVPTIIVEYK